MDLGAAGFDLGVVVVVDENGENLAFLDDVAFFSEDLLELAGQLGADLNVLGIGLDKAGAGDDGLGDGRLVCRGRGGDDGLGCVLVEEGSAERRGKKSGGCNGPLRFIHVELHGYGPAFG